MPFVNVKVSSPILLPEQTRSIQAGVTTLMAEILRKKADLTAVLVEPVLTGWAVGGRAVAVAAHLTATVTEGTNTTEEKERFVEAAHGLLAGTLGADLPLATYVVVHEVPGDAWGYSGLTQAHRTASRIAG